MLNLRTKTSNHTGDRRTSHGSRRFLQWALLVVVLLSAVTWRPAASQALPAEIILGEIDAREFPTLQTSFTVKNAGDALTAPLTKSNITVMEADTRLPVEDLQSEYSGIHFALAINPSHSLALRTSDGVSNYEKMVAALETIGSDLATSTGDRYSLFISPDIQYPLLDSYSSWMTALRGYQESMRDLGSDMASLNMAVTALEAAGDEQDTVLLYLTPYLPPADMEQFTSLAGRLAALGIPLHVWIVMSPVMLGTAYEANLRAAVEATGGSVQALTGAEEVPDPKDYLEGKGYTYYIRYLSQVRESAAVDISIELVTPNLGTVRSEAREVVFEVEPAQLSFVNPLAELTIQVNEAGQVTPAELPLEILIAFNDGHPRNIVSTELFVNNRLVQENTQPPYGSFILPLETFANEDSLALQVELTDDLGLTGKSPVHRLVLNTLEPEHPITKILPGSPWLLIGLGAAAVAVLALVFYPKVSRLFKKGLPAQPAAKKEEALPSKPTPQPVEESHIPVKSFGSLIKLDRDNTPSAEKPLLLTREITLIGRDKELSNLVLDDPALEPLHAELHVFLDGRNRLTDFNTTAGTYVNYKPVGTRGIDLQHGDILHFGSLIFRFNSRTRIVDPSARQLDEEED